MKGYYRWHYFIEDTSKGFGDDNAIALSADFDVIDGGMRTAGDKGRQSRFA
jgi:hypothetical protein